jgi:hypothetical protein
MTQFFRHLVIALALCSVHILPSGAQEQHFKPSTWAAWNKSFAPQFPGKSWQKFATPEDAGWSSEKLQRCAISLRP